MTTTTDQPGAAGSSKIFRKIFSAIGLVLLIWALWVLFVPPQLGSVKGLLTRGSDQDRIEASQKIIRRILQWPVEERQRQAGRLAAKLAPEYLAALDRSDELTQSILIRQLIFLDSSLRVSESPAVLWESALANRIRELTQSKNLSLAQAAAAALALAQSKPVPGEQMKLTPQP